ncbi:hypothetical protein MP228_009505 [Amoeboaphelidium protococcarum]|nr:hypothetical protein MP228_009505 [Amoeboaphelidium protococcarum]
MVTVSTILAGFCAVGVAHAAVTLQWLSGDSHIAAENTDSFQIVKALQQSGDHQLEFINKESTNNTVSAYVALGSQLDQEQQSVMQLMQFGIPVMLVDVSSEQRKSLLSEAKFPFMKDTNDGSALLLIDTLLDVHDAVHYRVFDLPAGQNGNVVHSAYSGLDYSRSSSDQAVNDAKVFSFTFGGDSNSSNSSKLLSQIAQDMHDYLRNCAGNFDQVTCWNYVQGQKATDAQFKIQDGMDQVQNTGFMVPVDEGAVWRQLIETTYKSWVVSWSDPFPFKDDQVITHRLNTYWYLYMQAPPFQQLYYAFVLVDGLHNPNTQMVHPDGVGIYMSNVEIGVHAEREDGVQDPDNVFWLKSSPPTQNTKHEVGRSWSSTDSFQMSMNLGFKGEQVEGGLNFNYTKSFTASYSESREITDWSVIENTDPVQSRGLWRYSQSWPVDMMHNMVDNFPKRWPEYYEQAWNPCRCKTVPNLSQFALATHNSMVWGIKQKLLSEDKRRLPLRFKLSLKPKASAHTCEVYDGHHKMAQWRIEFNDMEWIVNVADLNNIKWN